VVLAHTVKGWALGPDFEARNATHQMKKMSEAELKTFRDRLELPIADALLENELPPYAHPGFQSDEYEYLIARRHALGGALPARIVRRPTLVLPEQDPYHELLAGTGDKVAGSTTSAFTRLLCNLLRDPDIGRRIVPIIPDEARTFGIDALSTRRHGADPSSPDPRQRYRDACRAGSSASAGRRPRRRRRRVERHQLPAAA
jgi:pyruvate dehydrogenase E1 component